MDIGSTVNSVSGWMMERGWHILLIIGGAILLRHFTIAVLSRIVQRSVDSSSRGESKRDRTLRANTVISVFDSILKIGIYTIAGLLVLSDLGVLNKLGPLIAGAGVLSLLLSFGIQTFVKDFVSGMFIVAENQYRVGDVVALTTAAGSPVEGTVTRITLRTTVLRDNDGSIHFVPNGNVVRAANQTLDYAKINIELTLPLSADLDAAEKAIGILGVAMYKEEAWQRSLTQAPFYHGVQNFTEDSIVIEVRARTIPAEQWRVSSELQKRLAKLLNENKQFSKKQK